MRAITQSVGMRWLLSLLVLVLSITSVNGTAIVSATEPSPVKIVLNGEVLDMQKAPIIRDGVTYVPARPFLEALEYEVIFPGEQLSELIFSGYDDLHFAVIAVSREMRLSFESNGKFVLVNGMSHELASSLITVNDTRYIPLRFTAEASRTKVNWDSAERTIHMEKLPDLTPLSIYVPMPIEQSLTEADYEALDRYSKSINGLPLQIEMVDEENYYNKARVMLAAGHLSDLMLLPDVTQMEIDIIRLLSADISPYLDDYPHLRDLNPEAQAQLRDSEGKLHALPFVATTSKTNEPGGMEYEGLMILASGLSQDRLQQLLMLLNDLADPQESEVEPQGKALLQQLLLNFHLQNGKDDPD